jgi:hypothetical protein
MEVTRPAGAIRAALTGLATIAILGFPGAATAATAPNANLDAPPADRVTLDVLTVNGSGCPAGTASVRMLSDSTGFRIAYSSFIVRDRGGSPTVEQRRFCQINMLIHVPQGFTYAIASADYRGQANLPSGATGLRRSNYYFQGSSDNNVESDSFTGPLNGTWRSSDSTATADLVYAPCGIDRVLNVNTELRVDSTDAPSWMSLRSSDGDIDTVVHFGWKHCP